MKEKKYEKDGVQKSIFEPEVGDVIIPVFDTPLQTGNFGNYILKARRPNSQEEIFVAITKGQGKKLMGSTPLKNKNVRFVEYSNSFGKNIGVEVF